MTLLIKDIISYLGEELCKDALMIHFLQEGIKSRFEYSKDFSFIRESAMVRKV